MQDQILEDPNENGNSMTQKQFEESEKDDSGPI
jgi:hypothetical protein